MTGWVGQRRAGEIPDRLALLTHPPVITCSARTPPAELPADSPIPLTPVDRGGQAAYHGPGRLIGYLVLNLRERGPGDTVCHPRFRDATTGRLARRPVAGRRLDTGRREARLDRDAYPGWCHQSRLRPQHHVGP